MAWGDPIAGWTYNAADNSYRSADGQQRLTQGDTTGQPQPDLAPPGPPPDGYPGWQWQNGKGWVLPTSAAADYKQWQAQNSLTQTAANATANQPTLADAQSQGFDPTGVYANAIASRTPGTIAGMTTPAVDATQTDASRQERDQALADQRKVLESTLNLGIDPKEQLAFQQRNTEQAMLAANTTAANARGGAGAVNASRAQVNQQMPALTGQAAQNAQQEELQAFNQRIAQANAAGSVASTIGQTATTGFSQEANLAQNNAQIGLQTIDRVLADSGQQIQADLQGQQQLGAMIQDINGLGLNYAQLDVGVQENIFDQLAGEWGIDENIKGQLKEIAAQKKKGVMDYIMGILGAGEGAATTAATLGKLGK